VKFLMLLIVKQENYYLMEEKNLKNKDISIQTIVKKILDYFGQDYFERCTTENGVQLIDFWESDLFAFGLKINEKSIYISSWDFIKNNQLNFTKNNQLDMEYYVEFEIIDIETFETLQSINVFQRINAENLIKELKIFLS